METILASHAHHVPQVGFPHIDPVIIDKHVKTNPMGAMLFATRIKFLSLKINIKRDIAAIQVNEAKLIQDEGT